MLPLRSSLLATSKLAFRSNANAHAHLSLRSTITRSLATTPHHLYSDKRWVNQKTPKDQSPEEKEKEKAKNQDEGVDPNVESKDASIKPNSTAGESSKSGVAEGTAVKSPVKRVTKVSASSKPPSSWNGAKRSSGGASGSGAGGAGGSGGGSGGNKPPPPPATTEIKRSAIPEDFPTVLALPITRRPLFPGFYKAVTITSPPVIKAIRQLLKQGTPYIGAFLLKDSDSDSDVITSPDQVHPVGVFAQITSVFANQDTSGASEADKEGRETLTAVLYPHRRIRIDELLTADTPGIYADRVEEVVPVPTPSSEQKPEAEVASFETADVPTVEEVENDMAGQKTTHTKHDSGPLAGSTVPYLHAMVPEISLTNVTNLELEPFNKDSQTIKVIMNELIQVFRDISQLAPIFREQITSFTINQSSSNVFDEPDTLADFAAAVSSGDVIDLQGVLASLSIEDRLQRALTILKKELINAQLQSKIAKDVETKLHKRQREVYLMEQLKGIKKELGMEGDGKDKLVEGFKEKAGKLAMPEGVKTVFDEEINKLMHLEPNASEFNVTRNYLDWLTQIPWGVHSPENFDISHAIKVLDEDHYGLKDVKDRILEFLAVGKLRGTVEGKIICMVGPPGVGKTSIGKSIARALDRQFYRFSVGGLTDVAEIKGHRRTYIGAMPGKPIQALKKVGTENPLILIDEIDKVGRGHNGDPSSALLEMLDPEQNGSFLDHYMDVPVDLSRVLFVCTANMLDTIPAPLLDRMEVLEVSGYVAEEKLAIADRYLAPQAKEASGLSGADITLEPAAIEALIRYYCRESGVRNLKKHIDKIYRKAAFKIVTDLGEQGLPEPIVETTTGTVEAQDPNTKPVSEQLPSDVTSPTNATQETEKKVTTAPRSAMEIPKSVQVRVTTENLKDYVGSAVYHKDRLYVKSPPAGVSTGLGYLGNGSGAVMPIEATSMPGKGNLQLTGKLGEVIRESAQIALSWVKSNAYALGITKGETDLFLQDRDVHLHMPEGGIGKEGPSAGTALLSAFVSLFTKTKINPDIALTGEVTLLGQVLPVGGLKEKILAAHRAGIKKLIVPSACKSDIDENVPPSVKEGIDFVFVEDVRQVLHELFASEPLAERLKEKLPLENGEPVRSSH